MATFLSEFPPSNELVNAYYRTLIIAIVSQFVDLCTQKTSLLAKGHGNQLPHFKYKIVIKILVEIVPFYPLRSPLAEGQAGVEMDSAAPNAFEFLTARVIAMTAILLEPPHLLPWTGFDHSGPRSRAATPPGLSRAIDRAREEDEDFAEPEQPLEIWEDDPFDDEEGEPAPGDFWLDPDDFDPKEF